MEDNYWTHVNTDNTLWKNKMSTILSFKWRRLLLEASWGSKKFFVVLKNPVTKFWWGHVNDSYKFISVIQ